MSRKPVRDISTVESELELSTFLNKGILAANSEHKLRIAELEAENEVLRTAESKLASMEDELERQREKYERLADERKMLHQQLLYEHEDFAARMKEVLVWKTRYYKLSEYLDQSKRDLDQERQSILGFAAREEMSHRSAVASSSRTRATQEAAAQREEQTAAPQRTTGKRRRVQDSPSDRSEDGIDYASEDDEKPPLAKAPPAPTSTSRKAKTSATHASAPRQSSRRTSPPKAAQTRRANPASAPSAVHRKKRSDDNKVKTEVDSSPTRKRRGKANGEYDSGEDPLALY